MTHDSWWKVAAEVLAAWGLWGATHLQQVDMVVRIVAGLAAIVFTVARTVILLRRERGARRGSWRR